MASDKIRLIGKIIPFVIPYGLKRLHQLILALHHRWTYKATKAAQNVVVIGASFAGVALANRLTETLPTGYRVVLIEKNSHFNFVWTFPRFSVAEGHEQHAFIPYDGVAQQAPKGIFRRVHATVTDITTEQVNLASGEKIDYAYLAIATGSSQPLPAKVVATESNEGAAELRTVQENIQAAERIAVIGGGAVGIEVATDIKSFYPSKDVALFHSRAQVLSSFGPKLHDYVSTVLEKLGITVVLEARPKIQPGQKSISLDGQVQDFDFIIPCTGQRPNSGLIKDLEPSAISKDTNRILVKHTLQIQESNNTLGHIFALGDVAETGGPKMGRAGLFQGEVIVQNILTMIRGQTPTATYIPSMFIEGALKLTLGKSDYVVYSQEEDGGELLVPGHGNKEDLSVGRAWSQMGVELNTNN